MEYPWYFMDQYFNLVIIDNSVRGFIKHNEVVLVANIESLQSHITKSYPQNSFSQSHHP